MIFLRRANKVSNSKSCNVTIPKIICDQLCINQGDDVLFDFQPGKKEVLLTKSPYDSQRRNKTHWTKEEIELLTNLCEDGIQITQEIAARFNRSYKAVLLKATQIRNA